MDKRYQVFISSTYADLKEERAKVNQALMELDCIPAGMELFPAIDEDQFEFIKKVIDDCDYYLLIIGGRYGSLSEDGLSYTEKEFDYAVAKGIKVIAFLHEQPDQIPIGKSEKSDELREKLRLFREKAGTSRLVRFWTNADQLPGLVALNLPKTIKAYPAVGWVRADAIGDEKIYKELNDLRKVNDQLKEQLEQKSVLRPIDEKGLAGLEDKISIGGSHSIRVGSGSYSRSKWRLELSWGKLFGIIAPYLIEKPSNDNLQVITGNELYKFADEYRSGGTVKIDEHDFQTIKIHLKSLKLIDLKTLPIAGGGSLKTLWELTPSGEELLMDLRSVKKEIAPSVD